MSNHNIYKIDHSQDIHKDFFIVNWVLGNCCNYKCSYCVDTLNGGTKKWVDSNTIMGFADQVIWHYKKFNKKIIFEFTGGEVTLFKDLYSILDYLKRNNCQTAILSNGSPKIEFWENIREVLDFITLSYHADSSDAEHFYSVVKCLHCHTNCYVNIMMNPKHFDKCEVLGGRISTDFEDVAISYQPLLRNLTTDQRLMDYTDEELKTIHLLDTNAKDRYFKLKLSDKRYRGLMRNYTTSGTEYNALPEEYIFQKKNNWKGWFCWTGLEQIVISQEGDVFRAWCCQDWLGNIHQNVTFPEQPAICTKDFCHCNFDIMTRKQEVLAPL